MLTAREEPLNGLVASFIRRFPLLLQGKLHANLHLPYPIIELEPDDLPT